VAQKRQQLFVVTGPESAGKSTLAAALADWLAAPLVPEVARDYLAGRAHYEAADVLAIAHRQQQVEDQTLAAGASVVVADTDYQVLALWWRERFLAASGAFSVSAPVRQSVDVAYLLCYPDLDWQPDPLRENPFDRDRLFAIQLQMLEAIDANFRVIWGQGKFRERLARQYVETIRDEFGSKEVAL